jgi:cell wall-associated NlpC family hydrolase
MTMILNASVNPRAALIAEARTWLGTPFRHRGRTRAGVDCIGLIFRSYEAAIGPIEDFADYHFRASSAKAFDRVGHYADRIAPKDAGPGDIVQMNYDGHSIHFGILTDRGVIHATISPGNVCEHGLDLSSANGRVVGYYRLRGIPPWRS